MSEPINLESLAADAAAQLQEVWNLIGVADAERGEFLADLSAKVAALYENAVASQQERQAGLEAEIEQLQQTVMGLQEAMDRADDGLVSAPMDWALGSIAVAAEMSTGAPPLLSSAGLCDASLLSSWSCFYPSVCIAAGGRPPVPHRLPRPPGGDAQRRAEGASRAASTSRLWTAVSY